MARARFTTHKEPTMISLRGSRLGRWFGLLVLVVAGCRDAPLSPSASASSSGPALAHSTRGYSGAAADSFLFATAAQWASHGDTRLAQFLSGPTWLAGRDSAGRTLFSLASTHSAHDSPAAGRLSYDVYDDDVAAWPATTMPTAVIIASSTTPTASGSSGNIASVVTFIGSHGTNAITYHATNIFGTTIVK